MISAGDDLTDRSDPLSGGADLIAAFWLMLSPGPGNGNVSGFTPSRLVTARTGRLAAAAVEEVPSTLALLLFALRPGRKLSIGALSLTRWRLLGGRAASAMRAREAAVDANKPPLAAAARGRGAAVGGLEAVPAVAVRPGRAALVDELLMAVPGRVALVDELLIAVPGREGGLVAACPFLAGAAAARAAVAAVGLNKELAAARVGGALVLRMKGAEECPTASAERPAVARLSSPRREDDVAAVAFDTVDNADAEPLAMVEADRFCEADRVVVARLSESLFDALLVANLAGAGAPLSPRSLETGRNDFFSTG